MTAPLVLSGSVANPGAIIKGTNTGNGSGLYGEGLTAGVYGENRPASMSVSSAGQPTACTAPVRQDLQAFLMVRSRSPAARPGQARS